MNHSLETLAEGFVVLETPRWRADRLWMSDVFGKAVYTLSENGERQMIAGVPNRPAGISTLPDGGVVVVSMADRKLMRVGEGGTLSVYADLSSLVAHDLNDTVCDSLGNIYVGNFGYDLFNHAGPGPAELVMVTPARGCEVVATGLEFPNGMVLTPDERTLIVAETFVGRLTAFDRAPDGRLSRRRVWAACDERTPDGICLDAEGAVWMASFLTGEFVRVREGGEVTDVILAPGKRAMACTLGGADGRTLFCMTFEGTLEDIIAGRKQARVEVCRVEVPGSGSP
ncbi:MAG: SMP-30/gluconolactonase/LRE family protein [Gammaproteobacteria bacterium]